MTAQAGMPPIGDRLRQARLDRGMTVRGLARLVDTSASLISQIETGKSNPSVSTLYAITAALGISVEDIFSDGGPRVPASPALDVAWPAPGSVTVAPPSPVDAPATSAAAQGLRMLAQKRRVGPVVTAEERESLQLDSGVTWELLGQLPDTHVDFLRITYAPGGSSSGIGVLMRHSGTEWGHVLTGQLTLTLGFDTYVLNPGDSVSFDCSTPHSYANHGVEPAIGVWFVAERFS
ncbi:helix-turn-helix domain-containing protein [Asanoa siamensis]|uniref:Cupin n=1 Tax=Asanoa siamensis TaxID=926357 RepID=A0ABQ4CJI8_9ACTN|nr:cupin domain-containing protein [Asanoa siamensis]GIF71439.1 cupin [Asanoa siamensis]